MLSTIVVAAILAADSELADFDFEPAKPVDSFNEDASSDHLDTVERRVDLDVMDDVTGDEIGTVNAFAEKEQQIRGALQRATKQGGRKFTEILPIMRTLSKPQKVVLASLISAQITASSGKELNFKQVT